MLAPINTTSGSNACSKSSPNDASSSERSSPPHAHVVGPSFLAVHPTPVPGLSGSDPRPRITQPQNGIRRLHLPVQRRRPAASDRGDPGRRERRALHRSPHGRSGLGWRHRRPPRPNQSQTRRASTRRRTTRHQPNLMLQQCVGLVAGAPQDRARASTRRFLAVSAAAFGKIELRARCKR